MASSNSDHQDKDASTEELIDFSDETFIPLPVAITAIADLDDTFGIFSNPKSSQLQSQPSSEMKTTTPIEVILSISFPAVSETGQVDETGNPDIGSDFGDPVSLEIFETKNDKDSVHDGHGELEPEPELNTTAMNVETIVVVEERLVELSHCGSPNLEMKMEVNLMEEEGSPNASFCEDEKESEVKLEDTKQPDDSDVKLEVTRQPDVSDVKLEVEVAMQSNVSDVKLEMTIQSDVKLEGVVEDSDIFNIETLSVFDIGEDGDVSIDTSKKNDGEVIISQIESEKNEAQAEVEPIPPSSPELKQSLDEITVKQTVQDEVKVESGKEITRAHLDDLEDCEQKSKPHKEFAFTYKPMYTLESIRKMVEEMFRYESPEKGEGYMKTDPAPTPVQDFCISPMHDRTQASGHKVKPIPFQLETSPTYSKEDLLSSPERLARSRVEISITPNSGSSSSGKAQKLAPTPLGERRSRPPVRLSFGSHSSQESTSPPPSVSEMESNGPLSRPQKNNVTSVPLGPGVRKLEPPTTLKFSRLQINKPAAPKPVVKPMKATIFCEAAKEAAAAAAALESPPRTSSARSEDSPGPGQRKFIPPIASSSPIVRHSFGTPKKFSSVKSSGYGRPSSSGLNISQIHPPSPIQLNRSYVKQSSPCRPRPSIQPPPSPILPRPNSADAQHPPSPKNEPQVKIQRSQSFHLSNIRPPSPRTSVSNIPSASQRTLIQSKVAEPTPLTLARPQQNNIQSNVDKGKLDMISKGELPPSKLKKIFTGTRSLRIPVATNKENRPKLSQVFPK